MDNLETTTHLPVQLREESISLSSMGANWPRKEVYLAQIQAILWSQLPTIKNRNASTQEQPRAQSMIGEAIVVSRTWKCMRDQLEAYSGLMENYCPQEVKIWLWRYPSTSKSFELSQFPPMLSPLITTMALSWLQLHVEKLSQLISQPKPKNRLCRAIALDKHGV